MKSAIFALAASIGAVAASHLRHEEFHNKRWQNEGGSTPSSVPAALQQGCCKNVVTVTVYGSMSAAPVEATSSAPVPYVTTCPTPGTYTFPAQTITVESTVTVVAYTTSSLTPGNNQWGGSTTVVTGPTTVTCPYVAPSSTGTTVTDIIYTTTYVCPSAGTYTVVPPSSTVCETSTVVVYPVPSSCPPGTYTRPEATVTATVADYVYWCPYEGVWSTTLVTETPAPTATHSSTPAPPINHGGNLWAMTYDQYTGSGQCKTADEVNVDIQLIASYGFTSVRIYATDCQALQNVGAACHAHGLQLILGVFIEGSGIAGAQSQVADIVAWGKQGNWGIVELIVIGNEAIFNGYCSAEDLAVFIKESKATFAAAGYSGPCTTTEPLGTLQQSASCLCEVIDVVAANLQPFFNNGVVAASAGQFVAGQLELVGQACPGKTAYNLECGWPSAGSANGAAVPGHQEQHDAIEDIVLKVGQNTVVFSFENDAWKQPGQFGVEPNFGCGGQFGQTASD